MTRTSRADDIDRGKRPFSGHIFRRADRIESAHGGFIMRRVIIFLMLLTASTLAAAQDRRANGDWKPSTQIGCIGGSTCRERRLRVELEDKPVLAVRFSAHDQVGAKAEGVLRVTIDGNTVDE